MKSILALFVVILSFAGMCGAIYFLMHMHWAQNRAQAELAATKPGDVIRIVIADDVSKKTESIADDASIEKIMKAFRTATFGQANTAKLDKSITLSFRDNRPPVTFRFEGHSPKDVFGPQVATEIAPYVARTDSSGAGIPPR